MKSIQAHFIIFLFINFNSIGHCWYPTQSDSELLVRLLITDFCRLKLENRYLAVASGMFQVISTSGISVEQVFLFKRGVSEEARDSK